jgi:hypothetical protein
MTDTDFLLSTLEDGQWHSHSEILSWSFADRGHGLTIHSRAADLRKRGYVVEVDLRRNESGRVVSFYRLVGRLDEAAASPFAAVSLSASSIPAQPSPLRADGHQVHAASRGGDALTLFQTEETQ